MDTSNEEILRKIISKLIEEPQSDFFDRFLQEIDYYYNSITIDSLNKKYNKSQQKGQLFEYICFKLCQHNLFQRLNVLEVWMFDQFPPDMRKKFNLSNKDMGIDMIAKIKPKGKLSQSKWVAIQCKYRQKPKRKSVWVNQKRNVDLSNRKIATTNDIQTSKKINIRWSVPWKDLSTFYSLVERTGPNSSEQNGWYQHIIMTNAPTINRQGRKTSKDLSICFGTFKNIKKEQWLELIGYHGYKLTDNLNTNKSDNDIMPDLDKLRLQRLKFFENNNNC